MISSTHPFSLICFRRWSRKKTSVLVSLHRVIKIGVLCMAYSLVNRVPGAMAQADTSETRLKTLQLQAVEITGRRSHVVSSDIARLVTVIQRDEIEKAGIQNLNDLLEYVSGADIRQRGNNGVQADVSIRGSSFDHVMILVNGVNLSDPQTGHLSLDIPVDIEAIEKIEVLEGPAARTFGPGAFMGAINIITRNGNINEVSASERYGMHGFIRDHLMAGIKSGSLNNLISASHSISDGYMKNTDFSISNLYYRGNLQKDNSLFDVQAGFQQKHFGAGGFYSPRFPDQYEETSTWFISAKASTGGVIKITPEIYWRRKKDHFLLIRDNPGFYENFHLTDVYGSGLNISWSSRYLTSTTGFDIRSEGILSNNIGLDNPHPKHVSGTDSAYYTKQYERTDFAVFQEFLLTLKKLTITTGAMLNWNSGFHGAPFFFPGIDVSYRLKKGFSLYGSVNRALHLPTFTDMFYVDPVNHGNINLSPNRMNSYEGGLKYSGSRIRFELAGFYNSGKDIIDWLWSYSSNRFSPVNLRNYRSTGISSGFGLRLARPGIVNLFIKTVTINYVFLAINKSIPDSVSKYYNLRNKLSMTINQQFTARLGFSWDISYQDRLGKVIGYQPGR